MPEMAIWNNNKIFLNSVRFPILPRLYTRGTDKTTLGREEKLMCVRIEIITCRGKPTLWQRLKSFFFGSKKIYVELPRQGR